MPNVYRKKPLCLARFQAHPQVPVGRCPPNLSLVRISGLVGKTGPAWVKIQDGFAAKEDAAAWSTGHLDALLLQPDARGVLYEVPNDLYDYDNCEIPAPAAGLKGAVRPVDEPFSG
jgi:hypothetical protein